MMCSEEDISFSGGNAMSSILHIIKRQLRAGLQPTGQVETVPMAAIILWITFMMGLTLMLFHTTTYYSVKSEQLIWIWMLISCFCLFLKFLQPQTTEVPKICSPHLSCTFTDQLAPCGCHPAGRVALRSAIVASVQFCNFSVSSSRTWGLIHFSPRFFSMIR